MKPNRNAGFAPLLLLGLVTMSALSATVGDQSDPVSLEQQNNLIVSVERKGAKIRILRQIPPSSTVSPPTTTPPTTTSSNSSRQPPDSSSTSTVSSATAVTPVPMQTTADVNISLGELRELDASGVKIKKNDSSIRSISDLNFTINLLPDNYVIQNCKIRSSALVADAVLSTPFFGNVSIDACVTKDNGSVAMGDETMALMKGQLKVNVEVKRWKGCDGACAKFVEVEFVIQVANGRIVKDASQDQSYGYPKRFSLGKDAWANFSRKVVMI